MSTAAAITTARAAAPAMQALRTRLRRRCLCCAAAKVFGVCSMGCLLWVRVPPKGIPPFWRDRGGGRAFAVQIGAKAAAGGGRRTAAGMAGMAGAAQAEKTEGGPLPVLRGGAPVFPARYGRGMVKVASSRDTPVPAQGDTGLRRSFSPSGSPLSCVTWSDSSVIVSGCACP